MTTDITPSARAARQSCRANRHCNRGARYVTGADIVRIARVLALEPWHFTQPAPASASDPTGIVLDKGRRRVNLRLANAAHGCVFLVRTLSGAGHCGLGDLAPISCRAFHIDLGKEDSPGSLPSVSGRDCGCPEETEADAPDREKAAEDARVWEADRDHWFEVIARWNALAQTYDDPLGIEDFQRYLLEAQTARETGAAWPEEVAA